MQPQGHVQVMGGFMQPQGHVQVECSTREKWEKFERSGSVFAVYKRFVPHFFAFCYKAGAPSTECDKYVEFSIPPTFIPHILNVSEKFASKRKSVSWKSIS